MRKNRPATILIVLLVCAVAMSSQGEAPEQQQGIFSGTFADALWTVVAFVLLAAVLGKFAWKPMLNSLNARQKYIQEQIETAENARKNAEKLLDEHKQQGLQILTEAAGRAQKQTLELIGKTQEEVLEIRRRAQDDIKHARTVASEQLWKEAGNIVEALSGEVLGRTITVQDNQRLIDDAINKLRPKRKQ